MWRQRQQQQLLLQKLLVNTRTEERQKVSTKFFSTGAGYGNVRDRIHPVKPSSFRHATSRTCSIIGAPLTRGQPYVGTDVTPQLLRNAGLLSNLTALGWRVEDCGDLAFADISAGDDEWPTAKNSRAVGAGTQLIAEQVANSFTKGNFPLVIGGDHAVATGSLAGIMAHQPDTGVLWIDAHADLNTPDVSESGNLHGMPLGFLTRGVTTETDLPPGLDWLNQAPYTNARLDPAKSLVYIGLRDVDGAERERIQRLGIPAFTMYDIDRHGIGAVMEQALSHFGTDRPLHVSYDIDAVDPSQAPATGTAVRGGLSYREAHFVAERVAATGQLASAEIVELNPSLSDSQGADDTTDLGLQLITSMLGKSIL